ncbi:hypothetical protein KJA17_00850 [Patescibacteria group bacterium]|nr:hypothetical protein [Patescibacteria group bacterium]
MNPLKNKKILILVSVALLLTTGVILIRQVRSEPFHIDCDTCIDLTASPTTIGRGESSTLTLKINNTPDSFAICSITPGVISNKKLNDGNYNYKVWPDSTTKYTATCTGGGGKVSDSITITVKNKVPNVPTLIAPPHNVWINYNPTFKARVSDPEGDNVRAKFGVDGYGEFWGNWVASGKISQSAQSISDGTYNWRALAQDSYGDTGNWSGYWKLKKDTVKPSAILDQENGVSLDTSIWVNLSESDDRSGIAQGDVDLRINGGSWKNYSNTINNFTYTGAYGNKYEFRYRVKDNAGNWSNWVYDGSVYLDRPPTATNLSVDEGDYCTVPLRPIFSWTFSDPEPGDTQGAYQVQVDNNSNFSSPEVDSGKVYSSSESYVPVGSLSYNTTYWWRLKVWDNHDAQSDWISGPSFTTSLHAWPYPDFSWSPPSPTEGEIVQFCAIQEAGVCPEDVSTCYDINNNEISCSGKSFLWTFPSGTEFATGTSSTSENPRVKFDSTGVKDVTLEITDDVGTCPRTKSVGVMLPLPRWREIAP